MNKECNDKNVLKTSYINLPYIGILTYILITLIISMFGPIEYPDYTIERKFFVMMYIGAFLFVTWIGMISYAKYKSSIIYKKDELRYKRIVRNISRIIFLVMIIKLMLLISSIATKGIPSFTSFTHTLARIYTELHREEVSRNIFRQIDSFTTFFTYIAQIGGIYIWKDLRKSTKVFYSIGIVTDAFYNLFYIGTQRILFTYFTYFFMIYIINVIRRKGKFRVRNVILIILFTMVVMFIFSNIMYSRFQYWGSSMPVYFRSGIYYNLDNWMLTIIPNNLKYQITTLLSYPTQGYYGLSLCLSIPFEWTYGIGGARGLNSIVSQIIPYIPNLIYKTYPLRAELIFNYPGLANWHTIFPWLASDLTFVGALIYMGFVARIYMKCWKQSVEYNNPISFILLTLLTIKYIFIPANNQLFIGRGDSLGIIIIFIIWLIRNKRTNFKY